MLINLTELINELEYNHVNVISRDQRERDTHRERQRQRDTERETDTETAFSVGWPKKKR